MHSARQSSPRDFGGLLSIQAMAWAIEQQEIKEPSSRFVLLCLCNYADVTGDAIFPSLARLSRDTGLGRRAIQYQLRKLEKSGILIRSNPAIAAAKVPRSDRRPVCYRIILTGRNPLHLDDSRGAIPYFTGRNKKPDGAQPVAPDPKRSVREPKSALQAVTEELEARFGIKPGGKR